jgi:two-component system nitrogen regulation response regulator NtrX
VRELRNVIERVVIMAPGDVIAEHDLAFLAGSSVSGPASEEAATPAVPLYTARDQFEREYILRQLAVQQGNISRTAEVLGVERSNLYRKMRAFGIAPSRRSDSVEDTEEEAV